MSPTATSFEQNNNNNNNNKKTFSMDHVMAAVCKQQDRPQRTASSWQHGWSACGTQGHQGWQTTLGTRGGGESVTGGYESAHVMRVCPTSPSSPASFLQRTVFPADLLVMSFIASECLNTNLSTRAPKEPS